MNILFISWKIDCHQKLLPYNNHKIIGKTILLGMKSEPKSELKDMDDSDTKSEENLKPDKNCINECGPNEQCCVCSDQCNLEPEDQELLHSLDALVGCENRGNCKVEV